MLKIIRDNMFYIGVLIFSFTLFAEHLFLGETHFTCFMKGFACGIELVGIIILIRNRSLRNTNSKR